MAKLLNGRVVAREHGAALRERIARLPRPPGLAVVRVGDDPASQVYVGKKRERAQRLGFHQVTHELPASTGQDELLTLIRTLNEDDRVDGVLVQLPLPEHIDEQLILDTIRPDKDVDGFHPENVGLLSQGRPRFVSCTPKGVMALLRSAGVRLTGANAVVIGRSNIVGRPVAMLLEQANATVTVCHSRTRGLSDIVRRADIVVAAVGRPQMVQGDWIREGAVVIDVGINRLADGSLVGDVDTAAADHASLITPVPGGVGPMTISMLMDNTVRACEAATGVLSW